MSEESDMDKAIKAASICFRMVYRTWRVGIYPSLPICLKSAFWKSAVGKRKH
ncbi:MAPK activated protein kinase 5 [Homo sapiens]|uniref:MAPK activated protein kinase 5 n=1 Tax=Homo sapiens TaxID=9606 RepID=R4GN93_HUMAN|nr:MAPK activated protein kinase 5 [Homo sapiens]KAI4068292.1 MAPK activated protein kinase 5 [Homo sapiens]